MNDEHRINNVQIKHKKNIHSNKTKIKEHCRFCGIKSNNIVQNSGFTNNGLGGLCELCVLKMTCFQMC